MRIPRALTLALAAALVLAGCADDGEPAEPESTWTPTSTPEAPSTSPAAAGEPALPEAATKPTEAGARAFIRYYWDLINYAQSTGDTELLRAISGSQCSGCDAGIGGVEALYRQGGRASGGQYSVQVSQIHPVRTKGGQPRAFEALVRVRNGQQTIVEGDGERRTLEPSSNELLLLTHWVDSAWRLDVMEAQ